MSRLGWGFGFDGGVELSRGVKSVGGVRYDGEVKWDGGVESVGESSFPEKLGRPGILSWEEGSSQTGNSTT